MLLDTPSQFIPRFLEDFLGAAGREYRDQSIGDLLSNVVSGISSKIRIENFSNNFKLRKFRSLLKNLTKDEKDLVSHVGLVAFLSLIVQKLQVCVFLASKEV